MPATGVPATGVLATQGGRFGGWGLLLNKDGQPEFDYAYSNQDQHKYRVRPKEKLAPEKLAPGKPHTIKFDFKYNANGSPLTLAWAAPAHSPWTAKKSRKAQSSTPSPPASRSTRRSTSAWTPVRPSSRTMRTRCRSSSRGTLKKVVIELGKPGLTANDEKKLKEQAEKRRELFNNLINAKSRATIRSSRGDLPWRSG